MTEICYHVGHLAVDRYGDPALDARAKELWNMAAAGKIELYQRRQGDEFAYYWRPVKGAL